MVADARISLGAPDHPKVKKLVLRLGDGAAYKLFCLWLWTAGHRPDGDLSGMDADDLEIAIDWKGERGLLVRELLALRLLDGDEGTFSIHDWAEHNPWVHGAGARRLKAKLGGLVSRFGPDQGREIFNSRLAEEQQSVAKRPTTSRNKSNSELKTETEQPTQPEKPSSVDNSTQDHKFATGSWLSGNTISTSTSISTSTTKESVPKKRKNKTPETLIATDFGISDRLRMWAASKGHENLEQHLESFISKCKAKGYTYVDWDEAFMDAIRKNWAQLGINGNGTANGNGHYVPRRRERLFETTERELEAIRRIQDEEAEDLRNVVHTQGPI